MKFSKWLDERLGILVVLTRGHNNTDKEQEYISPRSEKRGQESSKDDTAIGVCDDRGPTTSERAPVNYDYFRREKPRENLNVADSLIHRS